MSEVVELGRAIPKADYDFAVAKLPVGAARHTTHPRAFAVPTDCVFGGVDGAGKSETMDLLNEWMDPRFIVNRAFEQPSDERARPPFWRF
jgi:polyphosphate kinase 2 (PPK2 family)